MTPIFVVAALLLCLVVALKRGVKYGLVALVALTVGYMGLATLITSAM